MKRTLLALSLSLAAAGTIAAPLQSDAEKAGYAVGVDMGRSLFELNTDDKQIIDFNAIVIGLRDTNEKRELQMSDEEMQSALETFSAEAQTAMQNRLEEMHKKVKEDSTAFLEENGKKDGVKTTDSGLQYLVVKEGEGKQPGADDRVQVIYEGRLIDGTVFDSSEEPISFGVGEVIEGWVEGLQLMKEGAQYTFFIPSDLAYGDFGQPMAGIMPGAALVFDVTLVKVEEESVKEKVEEAVEAAKDKAEAAAESVKEKTAEAVEAAKDKAEEVLEGEKHKH